MTTNSISARALEAMPPTAAPPSFNGHGWLFALNLTVFTAGFYIGLLLVGWLMYERRRYHGQDRQQDPVAVWRLVGLLMAVGFTIRCGAEAYNLWAWDPREIAATATAQRIKRILDPIALAFGASGLGLFFLSARSLTIQLRKKPMEVMVRPTMAMLKTPLLIVLLTFVAAIGVTSTR